MPTIVSSIQISPSLEIFQSNEGQFGSYNNQTGRYFTEVLMLYIPNLKGTNVTANELSYDVNIENSPTLTAKIIYEYHYGKVKKITWSYDVE